MKKIEKKGPPKKNEEKETQQRETKDQSSTENLSKYLVLDDWDVPLVSAIELCMKDRGPAFVPQRTGEEIFEETGGRMLSVPKGRWPLLCLTKSQLLKNECKERKIRIRKKKSGAVDFVTRWIRLSNLVTKRKPQSALRLSNVKNETSRIVVMFVKKVHECQGL